MTDIQKSYPTYNIKVVAKETGVKPETIRSWERRYGLPRPERTHSGHRKYSDNDISIIQWLAQRQKEGMNISSAVSQWQNQDSFENFEPTNSYPSQIVDNSLLVSGNSRNNKVDLFRNAWVAACLAFDRPKAEQILSQAFSLFEPEQICLEILQKGMVEIGMGWEKGNVTIQQEHFASALTMHRLESLVSSTPPPIRKERILIGCAPEDHHTFSPLLLTYLLRRQGWDVIYLGANVPAVEFGKTVKQIKPHLVIISAQRLYTAATLLDVAREFEDINVTLAYGGQIFNYTPQLQTLIPGHFLGYSLKGVEERVSLLLADQQHTLRPILLNPIYLQTLNQYEMKHTLIESDIWKAFQANDISTESLTKINQDIYQAIVAVVKLGDFSLLGNDVAWIRNLLTSYRLSDSVLVIYLSAYHQAALYHLDDSAIKVVKWLQNLLNNLSNN